MMNRAVESCGRSMELVRSASPIHLSTEWADEIQMRLQKVVSLLRRFEKTTSLKTRWGRVAAQAIEEAALNLEGSFGSLGSGDSSPVMESLSGLEQCVEAFRKEIQRLKRVVT